MDKFAVAAVIEEDERIYQDRVRLKRLRDASNPFELRETKFRKSFRLPNDSARYLCELLYEHPQLQEIGTIPKHLLVLAALHFYADGSYQNPVGADSLISMSQPTMCRAIDAVMHAILDTLTPQHIKFPTTAEEKGKTKTEFLEIYNIPNVLGAVDGTHVAIFKPPNNDLNAPGKIFYNRKGYYSINCQVVSNAKGRIISINPNFPGSTHDSAVWRASDLSRHLEREFLGGEEDQWLLGDKGYQLTPWLMIPLSAPTTEPETRYNLYHARARNIVEMTFGRMKNKLRCLLKHCCLHYKPKKAAKIIVACCTIYNMFSDVLSDSEDEDEDDSDEEEDSSNDVDERVGENFDYLTMGQAKRELT